MNLISCESCGVVLNTKFVHFPEYIMDDSYCIDERYGMYDQKSKDWVAYITCPVCKEKIPER